MKIVTVEQMIDLEQRSADVGAPPDFLMENAGLAVANSAQDLLGDVKDRSVLILVGPGNNGGDGLVAARYLHDWGARVHLFLVKRKTENDKNLALDMERGIPWTDVFADSELSTFDKEIAKADGLKWKVWDFDDENSMATGVYLFKNLDTLKKYVKWLTAGGPTEGVESFEMTVWDVQKDLTKITRGPL